MSSEQRSEDTSGGLPGEAWSKVLSFVQRDWRSALPTLAVARWLRDRSLCSLSWEGAAARVNPEDLRSCCFEWLVPSWALCERACVDFKGAHVRSRRLAAERCFVQMLQCCPMISSLCVRNWCHSERSGLGPMRCALPQLRHLELSGCDQISSYDALVPLLREHPSLLSLRATFHPRATAGAAFCEATPPSLVALGFVSFQSPENLAMVLQRSSLEHLWLTAHGWLSAGMASVLCDSGGALQTLSLPSETEEELCAAVAEACPRLRLLSRMRVGCPPFGTGPLASAWEPLPSGRGTVLRRRGSPAQLAANGALWAPEGHGEETQADAEAGAGECASPRRKWPTLCEAARQPTPADQRCARKLAAQVAAAVVAARRSRAQAA